jgi:hypothetical protein
MASNPTIKNKMACPINALSGGTKINAPIKIQSNINHIFTNTFS